jgi:putative FmdB family regulatory protein
MPLYEYECPRTGKRFEAIQKFSDAPLTRCPDCDQHPDCAGEAKKLLSAPAIQFKGAGWYVNDYGKGGEKPKKDAADSKSGDSKPGDSKSGDTKPAEKKPDSKPAAKESSSKD